MFKTVLLQVWVTIHWHQKYMGITELDTGEMGPGNMHI